MIIKFTCIITAEEHFWTSLIRDFQSIVLTNLLRKFTFLSQPIFSKKTVLQDKRWNTSMMISYHFLIALDYEYREITLAYFTNSAKVYSNAY